MPSNAVNQMRIVQGDAPRRVYGARVRMQRETHALVVATTEGMTVKGQPGALWWTDLRRGRLNVYGGLLRFLEHLHRRGVPLETALMIPEWIAAFIRETWSDKPSVALVQDEERAA